VLASIIGSIAVVSASIYVNLHGQAMADSRVQQETNLGVAATILERRISGSVLTWSDDGTIGAFQSWAIPPFYDSEVIDSVTRVTRQDAAIYILPPGGTEFLAKTTSIELPDGSRAIEVPLPSDSPAVATLMEGSTYLG